ncbi:MAG: methyltransferase domain-containing protein [Calditrichaeota bacterium]|nr:methyltransferase domain-containing protein [Calditrichota bacterium]
MDILNQLPERRYREIDDLLAFVSIYDDDERTAAFSRLLRRHAHLIRGAVCVEAGCGLGIFSEMLARMGARTVYAVEHNPLLAELARQRLAELPNVQVVETDILDFAPPEPVDVLVHEFYGQLLFDEDLWVLDHLQFEPNLVLPDGGELRFGLAYVEEYADEVVTPDVVRKLEGALVSGLFEERKNELAHTAAVWRFGSGLQVSDVDLSGKPGDLLIFGLRVTHKGRTVCEAARCSNWSYVWTPRAGDRFRLRFLPAEAGRDVEFTWLT